MLRVCLDDAEVLHLLFRASEDFARASVPEAITEAFMAATMTALQKPDGATDTTFRKSVAKTLARQFGNAFEATCALKEVDSQGNKRDSVCVSGRRLRGHIS